MIDNRGATPAGIKPTAAPSTTPAKSQQRPQAASSHSRGATQQILARSEREAREAVFPDLRNVGILARALVLYVAMVTAYAISITARPIDLLLNVSVALAESLPVAATVGAFWALASRALRRLAYWQAAALMVLFTALVAIASARWMDSVAWRSVPLALIGLAAVLVYFHTLGRALSPAVTEARLQALQARIRPHFLFNSINGVLGVLRADPKRAESALMDMAELFRVLMRENRDLQPLTDEIALTRQYLDLEKLRLGDRLNVVWKLDKMPAGALVPPLVLQPIAENAVYHGIEPIHEPGEIEIEVSRLRSEVIITVRNPFLEHPGSHHGGNKMAMQNIRERLALHFDAEARMSAGPRDGRYQVQLVLPYRAETGASADRKSIV